VFRIAAILGLLAAAACDREIAGGEADGARIYAEACERCHGPAGSPDPGLRATLGVKDLTEPELHQRLSDDALRGQVRNGSANKKMPAFGPDMLSDQQVDALIVHIRSLRR
jgi:mono/diheme cytochrome c family protein